MSNELTPTVAPVVATIPTTASGTPKRTNIDVNDVGIIVEKRDNTMWSLLLDTEKHIAFSNKAATEQTFVKAQWKDEKTATKWSLVGKQLDPEAAKKRLAKDIKAKVRKAIKSTATREDLQFLMRNGFSKELTKDNKPVLSDDGKPVLVIDAGKIESVHADILAEESRKRALAKAAQDNGSLAAKLQATLNGDAQ